MTYDILIVGGGAAGMAAAIAAKERDSGLRVTVVERNDRVGKKIALTGNGRCNITNRELGLSSFHGTQPQFARYALLKHGLDDTLRFFEQLGILIKFEERGRGYPYSLQASSVVDGLRFRMEELGVKVISSSAVSQIRRGFHVRTSSAELGAKRVIVAAGGNAAPKTGSDGAGCRLLKSLGHSVTDILPAIVQLKTETALVRQLKGIKADCVASVLVNDVVCRVEQGEVLFTEYGLSGPPVLAFSRIAAEHAGRNNVTVSLDFMPEFAADAVGRMIHRRAADFLKRPLAEFFSGMLNKRIGQVLIKSTGKSINDPVSALTVPDLDTVAKSIKDFRLPVKDTTGFAHAQTTAGGMRTDEFCDQTMESKLCRGLYAAGEVLDIDGDCGGYNLQWAWSSGRLAGEAAAESLRRG